MAVLLSTGAAFLTVVVNYYAPAKVFKFLIDSSGAIALLVYLVIAVSQLRMRKFCEQKEAKFACECGFIRGSPG
ncbi:gamma-aminobutyrate transporter [Escherichia coli]|uniref:Gamma-aminobutyrate transporter n=1 Tax=Escherichia coli TaxID=562 RepID=A0A376UGL4_ECOLX|nr:gamma-aminobutyrate transporter [Escherichia coli]